MKVNDKPAFLFHLHQRTPQISMEEDIKNLV